VKEFTKKLQIVTKNVSKMTGDERDLSAAMIFFPYQRKNAAIFSEDSIETDNMGVWKSR